MKVLMRERDLSDEYILFAQQIGADGFDIHNPNNVPGFKEQGYPDQETLTRLKKRIEAAGLGIYRVAPPDPRQYGRHASSKDRIGVCGGLRQSDDCGAPGLSQKRTIDENHRHPALHSGGS